MTMNNDFRNDFRNDFKNDFRKNYNKKFDDLSNMKECFVSLQSMIEFEACPCRMKKMSLVGDAQRLSLTLKHLW